MAPEDGEINNTLLLAMAEYTCKRKGAPMLSYLPICEQMNKVEFQGVLQFALEQRVSSSYDQVNACKTVFQVLAQTQARTDYAEEFEHAKGWIDEVLCFLWTQARATRVKPSEWVGMNMDLVLLVLPIELPQLVDHTGSWLDKEQEVLKVVVSCELGRSLFGFAIRAGPWQPVR